ncbi:MAG: hypothetical protein ABI723_11915 [Bacteroidia bacterium]
MKKKRKTAFTIAFLDVLSNALASVLIITLVKLQPSVLGDPISGGYYIRATSLNPLSQDSSLAIAVKFKDNQFAHEPSDYFSLGASLNYSNGSSVSLNFLHSPKPNDFEEVIVYSIDPNFNKKEGEVILIEMSLPEIKKFRKDTLNISNEFRTKIIENGKCLNQ